jgi:hypothetical protein
MPAPLRRQAVVFHMPVHEPPRLRAVEAFWRTRLCLSAEMATTSCVLVPIPDGNGPCSLWPGEDQFAPMFDWRFQPRGMGFAPETKMDEVADIQSRRQEI